MKKLTRYRYLGTNGVLETDIELPGVYNTTFYRLIADEGKLLTNGEITTPTVITNEKELANWTEIDK